MTPEQQEAVDNFNRVDLLHDQASEQLKQAFSGFKELVKQNKFEEAKEYLRPMPFSATKAVAFALIITAQDAYENKEN